MSRTNPSDLATPIMGRTGLLGGLTKREEFAKAAMQGILSNPSEEMPQAPQKVAEFAVRNADALIEELNKEQ